MIQQEKNKLKTDQAWNRLHARLEQDGLIPQEKKRKPVYSLRPSVIKWVAVWIVLCISASTFMFLSKTNKKQTPLTMVHNGTEQPTLMTTLEDGSIVYLADNTQLQYPEHFSQNKREVSLQGNALFDVSGNRQRPFVIETEQIKIEVLGTAFNVRSSDKAPFELSVKRGKVKVTLKRDGQSQFVTAGQTVILQTNGLQVNPTTDTRQFASYLQRIQFKDERLANIIRAINLSSDSLELEISPTLKDRRLTVSFHNDTPKMMTELICLALNLKWKQKNNKLLISEN